VGCGLPVCLIGLFAVGCGGPAPTANPKSRSPIVKISVGTTATTALAADGSLWYWGAGDLAPGNLWTLANDLRRPTQPADLGAVADVSWGLEHACLALRDGSVSCWGDPYAGALGHATDGAATNHFAGVPGLHDIASVVCFDETSCALSQSGQVYCWGLNNGGQVGIGVESDQELSPRSVQDATDVVQLAAGGSHACALRRNGQVICWGTNVHGESGSSDVAHDQPSPVTVPIAGNVRQLACGPFDSYAVMLDGSVMTWGSGTPTPHVSTTLAGATFVAAATQAPTCALLTGGSAECFGDNTLGVLGDGETGGFAASPVRVLGLTGATQIDVDYSHVCALDDAGNVWCWGDNSFGNLGDGTTAASSKPIAVDW
jgi:alpha-tubulin suppressor-like RCC1 family protein